MVGERFEVGDVVIRDSGDDLLNLRLGSAYEVVRVADGGEGGKQVLLWVEDAEGARCVANPARFRVATVDETAQFYQDCSMADRIVSRRCLAKVGELAQELAVVRDASVHLAAMTTAVLDALAVLLVMEGARAGEWKGVLSPGQAAERLLVLSRGREEAEKVIAHLRGIGKDDGGDKGPLTGGEGGPKMLLN